MALEINKINSKVRIRKLYLYSFISRSSFVKKWNTRYGGFLQSKIIACVQTFVNFKIHQRIQPFFTKGDRFKTNFFAFEGRCHMWGFHLRLPVRNNSINKIIQFLSIKLYSILSVTIYTLFSNHQCHVLNVLIILSTSSSSTSKSLHFTESKIARTSSNDILINALLRMSCLFDNFHRQ